MLLRDAMFFRDAMLLRDAMFLMTGLAWDAMLLMTGVESDLLKDSDLYVFFTSTSFSSTNYYSLTER
jgi:hypothetical protein